MKPLELAMYVLSKLDHNEHWFEKELTKSLKTLDEQDREKLKCWCIQEYGGIYPEIIVRKFRIINDRWIDRPGITAVN